MSSKTSMPIGFHTTRWSIVMQAGGTESEEKTAALSTLCGDYWYPVYAFVRRHRNNHHDAQDLTQGFFELVLERDGIASANPDKGRFRSYLLKAAKNFVAKKYRSDGAQKRGGGVTMISSDSEDYDSRFQLEAAETDTPEVLYHRSWANTLLARVMAALGAEYESAGKGELFGTLKEKLVEQKGETSNDQAAEALNMTSGAVAVALHRLRKRYRILLRREVSDTLAGDDSDMDVDEEIQQLLAAVR